MNSKSSQSSRRVQISLKLFLLVSCLASAALGAVLIFLTTFNYEVVASGNVIELPNKVVADQARQLSFEYALSNSLRVRVKGQAGITVLPPNQASLVIKVYGTDRWRPWNRHAFSRDKFIQMLQSEIDQQLKLENGTRVTELPLLSTP